MGKTLPVAIILRNWRLGRDYCNKKKKSNSWNERNLISWSVDRVNSQPGWKSRHPLHNSAALIFLWIFGPKDFVHLSTCPYSDRGGLLLCAWEGGEESFLRISYFHISFSTPEEFQFQTSTGFAMKPIHSYRPKVRSAPNPTKADFILIFLRNHIRRKHQYYKRFF